MWGILTVIAQCLGENHWHQLWGRARTFTTEKSPTVFTNTQESRHQSLITFDGLNAFWDLHLWQNRRAMWASLPTSIVTLWCQGFWYFPSWKSLGHSVSWRDKLHCGRTDIFWIGVVTNLYVSEAFFTHPVFRVWDQEVLEESVLSSGTDGHILQMGGATINSIMFYLPSPPIKLPHQN